MIEKPLKLPTFISPTHNQTATLNSDSTFNGELAHLCTATIRLCACTARTPRADSATEHSKDTRKLCAPQTLERLVGPLAFPPRM